MDHIMIEIFLSLEMDIDNNWHAGYRSVGRLLAIRSDHLS